MKRFLTVVALSLLLFFGMASYSYAAISVSQQATSTLSSFEIQATSTTATLASNPAPGDILCANIVVEGALAVTNVTGGGVTWSRMTSRDVYPVGGELWCGFNSTGSGMAITDTLVAKEQQGFTVADFTGIPNPSTWVLDTATSTTASSTALTTGTITGSSQTPEIMVGMAGSQSSGQGVSAGPTGGFTTLTNAFNPGSSALSVMSAWNLATGTASMGWTTNVSGKWVGLLAALEQATTSTPPRNLSATPGNGQVSLSWSAPSSTNGSPLSQYLVYDTLDASSSYALATTTATTTTSATIMGLTNGSLYDFEVFAQNGIGTSTASNAVSSTPATVPGAPTNVSATPSNGQAIISFSTSTTGGSPILFYTASSSPGGMSATSTGSPITVPGLTNGQSYTFTVTATNAVGTSASSTPSNSVTPNSSYAAISVSQRATSTNFLIQSTSTTATLASNPAVGDILCANIVMAGTPQVNSVTGGGVTWSRMTSDYAYPISGELWCGFNSSGSGTAITDTISAKEQQGFTVADFTGIPNPSAWALDTATSTTASSTALTTGTITGSSQTPEIMVGMAGSQSSGQGVSAGPTGGFTTLTNAFNPGSSALSVMSAWNLATGTASMGWTTNVSGKWVGLLAALEQATTSTPPRNLSATPGNGQVSLSWSAPSSTNGSPLSQYLVYDTLDASSSYALATTTATTTTSATIMGLTNGSLYDFEVFAQNGIGTSTASNAVSSTPAEATPNPPQNLSATPVGSQISLSWNAPSSNGMPISQYLVYYQPIGSSTFTLYTTTTVSQTTSTIIGLANGQSYNFEVVAENNIGNSSPSNIITASPFVFPWPTSNNYDGDLTNTNQYIATYIAEAPSWFAHVDLATDLSVELTNGSTTISTTTAEGLYNSVRSTLINAQGPGGQPILVGRYISGTTLVPQAEETGWPYGTVPLEWMPASSTYIGTWPGQPWREIIDVTSTSTVQALQAGIQTLWAEHPSSLYMVDNAAANSVQGGTQPWQAQCNNIMGIREIANAMGSAVVFNVAAPPGLVSASDIDTLIQAVGEGNALMFEDPWEASVQASSTLTQVAVNTYRQMLNSGIAVVMLPVSTSGETLSSWVQTWRKLTDNLYIASAFYTAPDPLVSGPFLPVNITAPTANSIVSGTISVSATATSSYASIASVQFYLDSSSTLLGTATASPYSVSWNTTTAANGTHTLYALATDNYSNTATSSSITITVANQAVLSMATSTLFSFSAAHGSTATSSQSLVVQNAGAASTTLNWSASSTQPWLTFSPASGSLGGGASTSIAFIVNPAALALGTYNATATISDPAASGSPQTIPVTLAVSDTGISASMTSPTGGAIVSGTVPVAATATSTAGVASVQFYLDSSSTLLGTATASPYSVSWNTTTAANGTHTLYALATDNYSNTATSSSITITVANQAVGGGGGEIYIAPTPTRTSTPTTTPSTMTSTTPISETNPGAYAPTLRLVNDRGTYFLIQNGVLHGIADPSILSSFGFAFGDAETATAQDLSLPSGANLSPDDGALVKTAKDPTVYLISGQKRHGFTSTSVFRALGFRFSFVVIVTDPELNALPLGDVISDPKSRHLPGVNVDVSGTVYFLGQSARHPYPSLTVYNSWNLKNDFGKVVRANAADLALPLGSVVEARVVEYGEGYHPFVEVVAKPTFAAALGSEWYRRFV